jgi:nitrogen PTS system EIIA component
LGKPYDYWFSACVFWRAGSPTLVCEMLISDLMTPQAVLSAVRVSSAKSLMQLIARSAGQISGVSFDLLLQAMQKTETEGSIALGAGVAIPHGRVPSLGRPFALLARLETPVDLKAVDGCKVDLVIALFTPESADTQHLQALAALSRQLRSDTLCDKLRGCTDSDALYAVITASDARQAA